MASCVDDPTARVVVVFVTAPEERGVETRVTDRILLHLMFLLLVSVMGAVPTRKSRWPSEVNSPRGQIDPAEMRVSGHQVSGINVVHEYVGVERVEN